MPQYNYRIFDLYRRTWWSDLPLTDVEFNDPVEPRADAVCTAHLHVGDDVEQALLDRWDSQLVNLRSWLIVQDSETGQVYWNGILLKRPWSTTNQWFNLEFKHSRWWFSQRLLGWWTVAKDFASQDKLALARALVAELEDDKWGDPHIVFDGALAGVNASYRLEGNSMRYLSEALAEIAAGSKGFEWDLVVNWSATDGRPELKFVTYYPELKYGARISLRYSRDGSGNILVLPDEWPNDASEACSRVWALGSGTDENQAKAKDTDPLVNHPNGAGTDYQLLLTEKVSTYSNTNDHKTLSQNARAERIARSRNSGTVEIGVADDNPSVQTYWKGVRARLQIEDRFLHKDYPNVRVIEVKVSASSRDQPAAVTLVVDLNDYKLPDGLEA